MFKALWSKLLPNGRVQVGPIEPTKEDLIIDYDSIFAKAVEKEVEKDLKRQVENQLMMYLYDQEVVAQTNAAREHYFAHYGQGPVTNQELNRILGLFPRASYYMAWQEYYKWGISPQVFKEDLITKLTKEILHDYSKRS